MHKGSSVDLFNNLLVESGSIKIYKKISIESKCTGKFTYQPQSE